MNANAQQQIFTVQIEPMSFSRSSRGQITGVIYVNVAGRTFPDEAWSDSVVTMLKGWSKTILGAVDGSEGLIRLHFMDGVFLIEIDARSPDLWKVRLVAEDEATSASETTAVPPGEVVSALVCAADVVISECERRAWSSRDLVHLATLKRRLAQAGETLGH
jgi:hypothetical protein